MEIINKDNNNILWTTKQNIEAFFNISNDISYNLILTENGELKITDNNNNLIWSNITQPTTTKPLITQPINTHSNSSSNLIPILNAGIDLLNIFSDKNYMSERGIHLNSKIKGPRTNLYQKNFSGTSNVYSPYLHYNKNNTDNIV